MPRRTLVALVLSVALALGFAACGDDGSSDPTPTPEATATPAPPTPTVAPGETPFPGGFDPVISTTVGPVPSLLVDVQTASHDEEGGYDRITFTFEGNGRPSYRVEYITPPDTNCGSGENAPVLGTAVVRVRFGNTNAHDQQGAASIPEQDIMTGLTSLQEAKLTCDFEAVVAWALGISEQLPFRVTELENPPRVAVDVAHP